VQERCQFRHGQYNTAIAVAAIGVAAITVALAVSTAAKGTESVAEDPFLEALGALEEVLADNGRRASLIKKRITQLRRLRSRGAPYAEIVSSKDGPLIVQLLTESSTALDTCGANVRRAEAHALYAEGLTMEQIAERFGVTRQRISTLLRKTPE
jgi:Sigma-70, region 4